MGSQPRRQCPWVGSSPQVYPATMRFWPTVGSTMPHHLHIQGKPVRNDYECLRLDCFWYCNLEEFILKTRNRNWDCWIIMNHHTINVTHVSALFDHRGAPSEIADPGDNNWEGLQRLLCMGDGHRWFVCTLKCCIFFLRYCFCEWSYNTATYRHPLTVWSACWLASSWPTDVMP